MGDLNKKDKLLAEFPPVSVSEWQDRIIQDLKGADYEKKLVYKPYDGLNLKPCYTSEDLEGLEYLTTFPDTFPYVRGTKKSGNAWFIRQDIVVSDLKKANGKALDILMKGIDSLGMILEDDKKYS